MSADLPCHRCGYDLRAHPPDGKCPECGSSVAESRRMAAIPRCPAWRNRHRRWRRHMVAGTWILVLLPLLTVLQAYHWTERIPVPAVFDFQGTVRTLDDTLLGWKGTVYEPLVFCIGVVLLFSKERERRPSRLDWTRRWGVICTYVVFILCAALVLFLAALVAAGIAACFLSMPLKNQPEGMPLLIDVSAAYLRYGPYPKEISGVVLVAFSSITILLACVPLFEALRSCGTKWIAAILVAPLALFSLLHVTEAGLYCLGNSRVTATDIYFLAVYFRPRALLGLSLYPFGPQAPLSDFAVEAAKWCIVLVIAVWLSIAQLLAWWRRKKANAESSADRDH